MLVYIASGLNKVSKLLGFEVKSVSSFGVTLVTSFPDFRSEFEGETWFKVLVAEYSKRTDCNGQIAPSNVAKTVIFECRKKRIIAEYLDLGNDSSDWLFFLELLKDAYVTDERKKNQLQNLIQAIHDEKFKHICG